MRLAIRARAAGVVAGDIGGPGLVRTWLCRGTLHLVCVDDFPWLHGLVAARALTSNTRRLAQLGADPADVAGVVRLLGEEGPLTREEIASHGFGGRRAPAAGGDAAAGEAGPAGASRGGSALHHLLHRAAVLGLVVMDGDRFVRISPPPPVDRDRALAELARRYLRGHGPATAGDLATWAGLPLGDARSGLRAIGSELVEDGGRVDLARREPVAPIGPRLLPAFDPYLLGWKDRSFAVPPALLKRVYPGGGMLRATATVDGVAVGTWSTKGLDVPDPSVFAEELADVDRFLSDT